MASVAVSAAVPPPNSKSKKNKKKKAAKEKAAEDAEHEIKINGTNGNEHSDDGEPNAKPDVDSELPIKQESNPLEAETTETDTKPVEAEPARDASVAPAVSKPASHQEDVNALVNGDAEASETEARLDALAKERSELKDEVIQLRKSLEELQNKHEDELSSLKSELEETRAEKEHADSQYRTLLGRVGTIKSQLGERLKRDGEDLTKAREQIEELESNNADLSSQTQTQAAEIKELHRAQDEHSKELSTIRNRLNLSSQNWTKEREDMAQREAYVEKELEMTKQAMQEWEVLAMEERSIRESLAEKAAEFEEQVTILRDGNQSLEAERNTQALNIDGLQRALRELQEARKTELREVVETSSNQVQNLQIQLKEAQEHETAATKELENARNELQRVSPMENEVKEKNLLIMKLRHEAVILNDHLTKALKQLKKGKPDDTVDRQLMTNHFLQFLALDRSDPKKFQVLQIISSMLNWNDEQRESAGLSRPGTSNPSLRTPISPWHRTPSTPSLTSDFLSPQPTPQTGVSLGGLWSDFLETESNKGGRGSRSTSVSSSRR